MNLKHNDTKFKLNANLIMTPNKIINNNSFKRYQYQINELTNLRNKYLDNYLPYKSFENDIRIINMTNEDLINDIKNGKQNMEILVEKLINIQSEGQNELVNIAKGIGEKITDLYKYFIEIINKQNEENQKLQIELNKALKENEVLRAQINFLTNELIKIEEIIKSDN